MSDILTKVGIPGTPAVPSIPGAPGTPAHAGYCIDIPYQILTFAPGGSFGGSSQQWVFTGYITAYNHVCYSATPAVPPGPNIPGQSATPADLRIGWNSGAVSIYNLAGDGQYQFSVPGNSVGVVTGLAPTDTLGVYQNITWAIYCNSGAFHVMENGAQIAVAGAYGTYATSDVFSIVRIGNQVRYFKGSTLLYTSTIAAYGALYADASMYVMGDAVNNGAFSTSIGAGFTTVYGSTAGVLTPLTGFATNTTSAYVNNGVLTPLAGAATATQQATCAGVLTPLKAYFCTANGFTEDCQGVLTPLTGGGTSGLIIPPYAIASCILQSLGTFSVAYPSGVAVVTGTLTPLRGFATNTTGAYCDNGVLTPLTGFACDNTVPRGAFGKSLSGYNLFAQGTQNVDVHSGFYGKLSGYSFRAAGGARFSYTLKGYSFSASGTATTLGEAVLQLASTPHYPLFASATETTMGRAYLAHGGKYTTISKAGGIATMALSGYSMSGSTGKKGSLGEVVVGIKPNHYVLTASGTQRNFGLVIGTLTPLTQRNSAWKASLRGKFSLVAAGHNSAAITYEGYSHTMLEGREGIATTHLTNYPFERIVRFGTKYYGVGPTKLFELTGNTFDGSSILSVVQTGESDMGDPDLKRTRSLYLAGRLGGDISVDVISAEITDDVYTYTPLSAGARNWRVKLGRGLQARYIAYKIQNTAGADFSIHEIGPEVDKLRRTA